MASQTNKLFAIKKEINNTGSIVSKVRVNREYLISNSIADELNTYVSFDPFPTFNDLFAVKYENGKTEGFDSKSGPGTPGVRSLFNKHGAVILGVASATTSDIISKKASEFRISNNVPLMDNPETRRAIKRHSGCTIKELVEASQQGLLGRETYSYADFMYCKYLGRISNNYMVTLRRFPYPVDDYISSLGEGSSRTNKAYSTKNTDSIGCMVTWMGTPGNEMANILKYSVNMPFTESTAKPEQQVDIDADSGGGPLNQIAALFDPTYQEQYMKGMAGNAVNELFKKFAPKMSGYMGDPPYRASDWNNHQLDTKVYGPVDTIKTTYMRSSEGLNFQQNLTLVFDYELRSYNGINPRQAMLDLLSSILNVTYSTGTFWGGGWRGGGAHQNNIFANLEIFKAQGGLPNFMSAFSKDTHTIADKFSQTIEDNGGIINTFKNALNTLGGMVVAGLLNKAGRPQKQKTFSILSPAPIGFWHVTIGNPHHPIMSIGNMILKNTTIEHYGPLGLDDFPTGLKITCELTRGKSRDIRDIEKLYMKGNDRIYTSMGPKVFDMYKNSKEYKSNYKALQIVGNPDSEINVGDEKIKIQDLNKIKHVIQKYFGHADTTSIMIAAMEQENGAAGKQKEGTAGGNSQAPGAGFGF